MNRGFKLPGLGYAAPNDPRLKPRPLILGKLLQQEQQQQQLLQQQQRLQSNQQELLRRLRSEQGGPNIVQQNTDNIERFHPQQDYPINLQPQPQQPHQPQQPQQPQQSQQQQSQPQTTNTQSQMKRNIFKIKSRPKKNDRQNGDPCEAAPLTAGAAVIATKSPPKSLSVTIALNGNGYHHAQQSSTPTHNRTPSLSRSSDPLIPSSSVTSMSSTPIQTITTASTSVSTATKTTTPPTTAYTSASTLMASTTTTTAPNIAMTAAQASLAGLTGSPAKLTSTTFKTTTTAAQAIIAAAASSPKASITSSTKKPTLGWAPTVAPQSTPRKQSSPLKSTDKPTPMLIELSPPTTPEIQKIVTPTTSTPKKSSPDSKKQATPFQWELYFQLQPGQAAPKEAFMQSLEPMVNDFQIGMKLEARDPKNNSSWCLASVIGIEGLRIKLRFDGAGYNNDFYELINSDSIRPYGSKPDEVLLPPISFEGNLMGYSRFVDKVLSKDEAIVAPSTCFSPIPKKPQTNLFKVGMKLEAIDRKNPVLICPASIGEVKGDDVKILFDGWRGSFDYTCKYYSRDIFPINWCRENNYYLTPPNGWEQIVSTKSVQQAHKITNTELKLTKSQPNPSVDATNSTPVVDLELEFPDISSQSEDSDDDLDIYPDEIKYQCQRALPYTEWPKHKIEADRTIATNASPPIAKNVSPTIAKNVSPTIAKNVSPPLTSSTSTAPCNQLSASTNTSASMYTQESPISKPISTKRGRGRPPKKRKLDDGPHSILQHTLGPVPAIRTEPTLKPQASFEKDSESDTDPPAHESWSVADVVEYIKSQEPEMEKYTHAFVEQEISGIAFVSLIPDMMIRHLGLKLGPALRIARLIERLKRCSESKL